MHPITAVTCFQQRRWRLNLVTAVNNYPLRNMADFAARLNGCQVLSKLDLNKGYLQVPAAKEDILNTSLITAFSFFFISSAVPFSLKGTVSRDFRPLVFFTNQPHLGL
jgi:hypothetical protein